MQASEKVHNLPLLSAEEQYFEEGLYKYGFKRALDLFLFLLALPIVLPFLLLLILLVKLDSRGPAIYKSERIGYQGEKFFCLKLRTMCTNADAKLQTLLHTDSALRAEWEKDHKLKNDPRITRIGKFIRAFSLDELPQIFNVLRGEMSFVGPRPIVEAEISKYDKQFQIYKSVRPGITGLWQISGRNDTTYHHRVSLDSEYAQIVNFFLDVSILIKTIPVALSQKGAY